MGESATFTGPNVVENILSRVTGGSPSRIDGTIRTQIPGAHLYVLNPSGVMFGPNARLDVRGSFHVSTADYLPLSDGARFSARLSENSTLSVAPPVAFGFLRENPSAITIQGSTLHVAEGKTLSVVGGDLTLVGNRPPITEQTAPTLGAPGGRIQLVSVAGPGEVRVSSPAGASDLQLEGFARLGRIALERGALVTVPSEGSPNAEAIVVRGGQLTLSGGSQLDSSTRGAGQGGNLTVEVDVLSLSEGASLQSRALAGGSAGTVTIRAYAVGLDSGGRISSHTLGSGTAGAVSVQAEHLSLAGAGVSPFAGILSLAEAGSTGDAGPVVVQADRLVIDGLEAKGGTGIGSLALSGARGNSANTQVRARDSELRNGGFIRSSTASIGNAGTVTVQAERLVLGGVGRGSIPGLPAFRSTIASGVLPEATGAGGDVRVMAGTLEIQPGGSISSATFGPGKAGVVDVQAGRLLIDGGGDPVPTGIEATAGSPTLAGRVVGAAGSVRVRAGELEIRNGGFIASNTFGPGTAGTVTVQAERLVLGGVGRGSVPGFPVLPSAIGSVVLPEATGAGGDVQVMAGALEIQPGGSISSTTFGPGKAGVVDVQASRLLIDGGGGLVPGGIEATAGSPTLVGRAVGAAGSVRVRAGELEIRNGGYIASSTFGPESAGTVDVQAHRLAITGIGAVTPPGVDAPLPSRIESSAGPGATGAGGAVRITANTLELAEQGTIAARSFSPQGNAGDITLNIASALEMRAGAVITTEATQADGGNLTLTAQSMVRLQDSAITAEVGGGASTVGGNITIDPEFVILENSQIVSDAFQGRGGNIAIEAGVFLADPDSEVSAIALDSEVGIDGAIDIRAPVTNLSGLVTPLPPGFAPVTELLRDQCAARLREGSVRSLVVRGRAGIPPRPESILPSPLFRHHRQRTSAPRQAASLATTVAFHPGEPGAPDAMRQGWASFHHGDFEQAARHWQQAVRALAREGKPHPQSVALAHLAQAYQMLGHYQQALQRLQAARTLAQQSGDRVLEASILGELGNVLMPLGRLDQAWHDLHDGLRLAREMKADDVVAAVLNNRGNFAAYQEAFDAALQAYKESARLAKLTGNRALTARALTNAALISLRRGKPQDAQALVDQAVPVLRALSPSHEKSYGLVRVGLLYANLRSHLPTVDASLLPLALQSFNDAVAVAQAIGDNRAASYAWGYLGKLYEAEGRYQEALILTRRAVFAVQHVQAPEVSYQWQWQSGRVLQALGQSEAAIDAYRQAIHTLQAIRHEMRVVYGEPLHFRETVEPLYAEFIDLLLQPGAAQEALEEARQLLETLKVAELQNHFRDECIAALRLRETSLDEVSQTAVVIYPILLPDRTELLVSLSTVAGQSKLHRFAVAIGADRMTQEIRAFRHALEKRTTHQYLQYARQLYDWLLRPLETTLASRPVTTLVFVPDGVLRTIPVAALHDGERFLIQKYALAITPGLNLTDPRPLPQPARVLAAGLSQSEQGLAPLPYVETELQAIAALYKSDLLLNQEFQVSRFEKTLAKGFFPIVHIASHGQFSSDLDDTFILTADGKLTLERLDQLLDPLRFREEPIELLTLSACQTAAGDDQAALGLAGVAVRAGARSALATLWYINDQASSELVAQFYRQLRAPSVSRAKALQRAQIHLLGDPKYQHPAYWAPFLLINSWL